jgi:hypothetical protein
VRKTARPEIANQQYAIIAPMLHCQYKAASENTVIGEHHVGDAHLDYDELTCWETDNVVQPILGSRLATRLLR